MSKTISFDIHAGKDGGIGIYEMVPESPAELVFCGNVEEATKYFNKRMLALTDRPTSDQVNNVSKTYIAPVPKTPLTKRDFEPHAVETL